MQTQNLQMPTLNANATAAPRVNLNLQASGGDNAFQRALTREMDQRQSSALTGNAAKPSERPAQSRAIARANEGSKPASPATPAPQNTATNASQNSSASHGATSSEQAASGNAETTAAASTTDQQNSAAAASSATSSTADQAANDAASDAQAAAQADPVAQMLALVAAFNQPISLAPASPGSAEAGNASAATAAVLDSAQSGPDVLAASGNAADAATLAAASDPASVASAAEALPQASDAAGSSASAASFTSALMQARSGAANADSGAAAAAAAASAGTSAAVAAAASGLQASAAPATVTPDTSGQLASADASDAAPELAPASVDTRDESGHSAPIKAGPASVSSQSAATADSGNTETLAATLSARSANASENGVQLKDAAPAISVASNAQSALAAAKAAVSAVPTDKLSSRVGTPAWDQQLGQKIIFMAAGGEQSATMELNPPDLGPLQVVLSINKDQATAAFSSAQPEVRQALEAALPKLKEMMSEAGIQLGNASVSAGMSDQGNAFNQQASAAQSGSGGSGRSGNANGTGTNGTGRESGAGETLRSAPPRRLPAGAVDTFA